MFTRSAVLLLAITTVAASVVLGLAAEEAPNGIQGRSGSEPGNAKADGDERRREGSVFEAEGTVQYAGERLTFVSDDGKERLTMLENLALDRVARTTRDNTVKTRWRVRGTVTEYQGTNYLWLERAVTVRRTDDFGL